MSITKVGLTREECIEALRKYRNDIDAIIKLIRPPVDRARQERAQGLLKELKRHLNPDYSARNTVRGRAEMSDVEKQYFLLAIYEAKTRIMVNYYSKPDIRWHGDLGSAKASIEFYLDQLEKKRDERKHRRAPLTAHVTLLVGKAEPPVVRHAMIADISLGGAGLYLDEPVEDGIEVKLEISFQAGGGTKTETVRGKTIYSYHIKDTYYVGIEFDQELNPLHQLYLCKRIQESLESF
jgi:hypothetical protein